jgi:Tfp pilus assembly protein PilX
MSHGPRSYPRRRGSVYVIVMCMTMLVTVITLGATLAVRTQIRNSAAASDFAVARLCARAGLEIAMFTIQTDPTWRTDYGNGVWFNNIALGQGAYSASAADPITGDVTLASNHPVVLTCTGTKGAASYQMQTTVQVNAAALSCVNVSMCGGTGITLQQSTLTGNQICASNGNFSLMGNSTISAAAQAYSGFTGGGSYLGGQQTLPSPLVLPDPVHVFDYYNANGASIPYTALYQSSNTQIVNNPSFESNVAGWYVLSPSSGSVHLSQDFFEHEDGLFSMLISGRNGSGDVPAQDLPASSVRNGDIYAVSVPVFANSTGTVQATLVIQSSTGTQSFSTPLISLNSGHWVVCSGNVPISWTGTLVKATLTLTCSNTTANLDIDKLSMTDTSLPANAYVMDRVLLSPTSNPYGSTNAQGIYILNCQNQNVTIGPCRIVGTLVLLNAGSNTTIQGPIIWEPAVPGYPAFLTASPLTISVNSSVGLSEATLGVNFNPPGTPYPFVGGNTNATASDGYPSIINGLIYCGGDLTVSSSPTINGCIISAGSIQLNSASLNLTYGNASYAYPPPGFSTTLPALYPVPGSWERVTH